MRSRETRICNETEAMSTASVALVLRAASTHLLTADNGASTQACRGDALGAGLMEKGAGKRREGDVTAGLCHVLFSQKVLETTSPGAGAVPGRFMPWWGQKEDVYCFVVMSHHADSQPIIPGQHPGNLGTCSMFSLLPYFPYFPYFRM